MTLGRAPPLNSQLPYRKRRRAQTFLELIKLYKSLLARKRKESQEAIDRLENGLSKLHKTQARGWGERCCRP